MNNKIFSWLEQGRNESNSSQHLLEYRLNQYSWLQVAINEHSQCTIAITVPVNHNWKIASLNSHCTIQEALNTWNNHILQEYKYMNMQQSYISNVSLTWILDLTSSLLLCTYMYTECEEYEVHSVVRTLTSSHSHRKKEWDELARTWPVSWLFQPQEIQDECDTSSARYIYIMYVGTSTSPSTLMSSLRTMVSSLPLQNLTVTKATITKSVQKLLADIFGVLEIQSSKQGNTNRVAYNITYSGAPIKICFLFYLLRLPSLRPPRTAHCHAHNVFSPIILGFVMRLCRVWDMYIHTYRNGQGVE